MVFIFSYAFPFFLQKKLFCFNCSQMNVEAAFRSIYFEFSVCKDFIQAGTVVDMRSKIPARDCFLLFLHKQSLQLYRNNESTI